MDGDDLIYIILTNILFAIISFSFLKKYKIIFPGIFILSTVYFSYLAHNGKNGEGAIFITLYSLVTIILIITVVIFLIAQRKNRKHG